MSKLKLASPWTTCFRQFKAFFQKDPEIRVVFNEDEPAINVYVEKQDKADALTYLIPSAKQFGNVTLRINIIPANQQGVNSDSYTNTVDALLVSSQSKALDSRRCTFSSHAKSSPTSTTISPI